MDISRLNSVKSVKKAAQSLLPSRSSGAEHAISPERITWIFGAGRTGSTWIAAMLRDLPEQDVWFEPRIGVAFDDDEISRHGGQSFFFSEKYRNVWVGSVRNLLLENASARFPNLSSGGNLFVKDPAGSRGAPTIMSALPESGFVLLVRDPRDVVSSWLDASKKGGWQNERRSEGREGRADRNPDGFVTTAARAYAKNVSGARKAFEAHGERKVVVRYEDLRADTFATMRRMYGNLNIPVDETVLANVVEKHSWENIPEDQKGEGKFYRKARARGWEEDLTPAQARSVERITADLMRYFDYA